MPRTKIQILLPSTEVQILKAERQHCHRQFEAHKAHALQELRGLKAQQAALEEQARSIAARLQEQHKQATAFLEAVNKRLKDLQRRHAGV